MRSLGALAVALLLPALTRADGKVVVLVEEDLLLTTPFGLDFLPDGSSAAPCQPSRAPHSGNSTILKSEKRIQCSSSFGPW
jgi:hypothetical protein